MCRKEKVANTEERDIFMLELVRSTIGKYCMIDSGDRVLVGVSGGPDSTALVHVLNALAPELEAELVIAHLNHNLRGRDSAEDEEYVKLLAARLGLTVVSQTADVAGYAAENGVSIQVAAREVRYRFFDETAKTLGCNKLATGHNANDQAETVLIHFLRGSGTAGLAGIPPVRDGYVIRPLIETPRTVIEQYCLANSLTPRLDSSNLKTVYTRNKIRLELIPQLEKEYNNKLVETLVRTAEIMRDEEEYLAGLADASWDLVCTGESTKEVTFDLKRFLRTGVVVQRRLIRQAWAGLTGTTHGLDFVHLDQSVRLIAMRRSGAELTLPREAVLRTSYNTVTVAKTKNDDNCREFAYPLIIPGQTPVPEAGLTIEALAEAGPAHAVEAPTQTEIAIDLDKAGSGLLVRSRKPGDWFEPFGLNGSKKLKKYLIDKKVPRDARDRIPVLVTADGQVVWIVGHRADRRWLAGEETRKALRLKLLRNM